MNKLKYFVIFFSFALSFFALAQKPQDSKPDQRPNLQQQQRQQMEKMFEEFFEGDSFKMMQERMETLFQQMEKDMQKYHSLFDDEHLNNFLRDSGLFTELNHGQHNWIETKDQRILVLKVEGQEDSPLEITVENGKVQVKGKVKIENIEEGPQGVTKSVSVKEIHKIYLIPEDCDPSSVEIENKAGEILVKFSKMGDGNRRPVEPQEDQKTI